MFGNALLVVLAAAASAMAADTVAPVVPAAVSEAVAHAAQSRLGKDAAVSVWQLSGLRLGDDAEAIVAVPDPAARVGAPARFVLNTQRRGLAAVRVGEVTATIQAVGPAVRTTRAINRGERLAASDVVTVSSDWAGRPLRPLPTLEQSVGARATRDLAMDTLLSSADIAAEPLVHAGETVRAHARIGAVDVTAAMVAVESGLRDDTIRVVNKDTRRTLRTRVVGNGEVEVIDVPE